MIYSSISQFERNTSEFAPRKSIFYIFSSKLLYIRDLGSGKPLNSHKYLYRKKEISEIMPCRLLHYSKYHERKTCQNALYSDLTYLF
jgi:hypothetical protein